MPGEIAGVHVERATAVASGTADTTQMVEASSAHAP
jgi:hypothetical protein